MCTTYVHSTYVLHDQLYNNSRVEVFACWESVNKNIIIASYNERHIAETYTVDTGPDLLGENLLFLNDFLFWSPRHKKPSVSSYYLSNTIKKITTTLFVQCII